MDILRTSLLLCILFNLISSIDVQMLQPKDAQEFLENTILFEYKYIADSDDPQSIHCSFLIDGNLMYAGDIHKDQRIQVESEGIDAGTHNWRLVCDGFYSPTRTFIIDGQPAQITLVKPENLYSTKDDSLLFNFRYSKGDFGPKESTCSLYLDGSKKGSIKVPDKEDATIKIEGLSIGEHEWYIGCDITDSNSRSFEILPNNPRRLEVYTPDGIRVSKPEVDLEFEYKKNQDGTDLLDCILLVDSIQVDTTIATSGVRQKFSHVFENRESVWQIICDPDSPNPLSSKERSIILSSIAEQKETSDKPEDNTTKKPEVLEEGRLPLIFPPGAKPGQEFKLKVNDSDIKQIEIRLPDSTLLILEVDENGSAEFTPILEGEYEFMADGYISERLIIASDDIYTSYIPKALRPRQAPSGFAEIMICASVGLLVFVALSIGALIMSKDLLLKEDKEKRPKHKKKDR